MTITPGPEPEFELLEHTPIRRAIGERTQTSFRDIPQFSLTALADAEALVASRTALKAAGVEPVPTYNDYILKAVADVIGDHPRFNAWYTPEGLKLLKQVNLAFAVATDQGVLLPTVYDADRKSLRQLAAETRELTRLARAGKLRASLQRNAGFTVTNIGPLGERLEARHCLYLTLTVDHRCADGAEGAALLADIVARLQREFD